MIVLFFGVKIVDVRGFADIQHLAGPIETNEVGIDAENVWPKTEEEKSVAGKGH
jgi:hypothetical protein